MCACWATHNVHILFYTVEYKYTLEIQNAMVPISVLLLSINADYQWTFLPWDQVNLHLLGELQSLCYVVLLSGCDMTILKMKQLWSITHTTTVVRLVDKILFMKLLEGRHPCWGGTFSLCSHSGVLYTSIKKLNRLIGLAGLGQNCFFG